MSHYEPRGSYISDNNEGKEYFQKVSDWFKKQRNDIPSNEKNVYKRNDEEVTVARGALLDENIDSELVSEMEANATTIFISVKPSDLKRTTSEELKQFEKDELFNRADQLMSTHESLLTEHTHTTREEMEYEEAASEEEKDPQDLQDNNIDEPNEDDFSGEPVAPDEESQKIVNKAQSMANEDVITEELENASELFAIADQLLSDTTESSQLADKLCKNYSATTQPTTSTEMTPLPKNKTEDMTCEVVSESPISKPTKLETRETINSYITTEENVQTRRPSQASSITYETKHTKRPKREQSTHTWEKFNWGPTRNKKDATTESTVPSTKKENTNTNELFDTTCELCNNELTDSTATHLLSSRSEKSEVITNSPAISTNLLNTNNTQSLSLNENASVSPKNISSPNFEMSTEITETAKSTSVSEAAGNTTQSLENININSKSITEIETETSDDFSTVPKISNEILENVPVASSEHPESTTQQLDNISSIPAGSTQINQKTKSLATDLKDVETTTQYLEYLTGNSKIAAEVATGSTKNVFSASQDFEKTFQSLENVSKNLESLSETPENLFTASESAEENTPLPGNFSSGSELTTTEVSTVSEDNVKATQSLENVTSNSERTANITTGIPENESAITEGAEKTIQSQANFSKNLGSSTEALEKLSAASDISEETTQPLGYFSSSLEGTTEVSTIVESLSPISEGIKGATESLKNVSSNLGSTAKIETSENISTVFENFEKTSKLVLNISNKLETTDIITETSENVSTVSEVLEKTTRSMGNVSSYSEGFTEITTETSENVSTVFEKTSKLVPNISNKLKTTDIITETSENVSTVSEVLEKTTRSMENVSSYSERFTEIITETSKNNFEIYEGSAATNIETSTNVSIQSEKFTEMLTGLSETESTYFIESTTSLNSFSGKSIGPMETTTKIMEISEDLKGSTDTTVSTSNNEPENVTEITQIGSDKIESLSESEMSTGITNVAPKKSTEYTSDTKITTDFSRNFVVESESSKFEVATISETSDSLKATILLKICAEFPNLNTSSKSFTSLPNVLQKSSFLFTGDTETFNSRLSQTKKLKDVNYKTTEEPVDENYYKSTKSGKTSDHSKVTNPKKAKDYSENYDLAKNVTVVNAAKKVSKATASFKETQVVEYLKGLAIIPRTKKEANSIRTGHPHFTRVIEENVIYNDDDDIITVTNVSRLVYKKGKKMNPEYYTSAN